MLYKVKPKKDRKNKNKMYVTEEAEKKKMGKDFDI